MSFIPFLQSATDTTAAGAAGSNLFMFLPLILIFVIMYFFMIRPQNKERKETEKKIAALKKGDKVVTIGGIHGTVVTPKEKTLVIKVDDNCKLEFNRTAIATVITEKDVKDDGNAKKKAEEIKDSDNEAKKDE
ncbi:MAG: preprotein translocase subunit YajC [Treponema sp.]|nr:preprotein translocase subunit YajC [Treponema sp.]